MGALVGFFLGAGIVWAHYDAMKEPIELPTPKKKLPRKKATAKRRKKS